VIGVASAPASSANLGPGFDCLALALELRLTAHVEPAADWTILSGAGDPGSDAASFIRRAAAAAGAPGPLAIRIESEIPQAAGLGSSAALAAAVAAAAAAATGLELSRPDLLAIVAGLEGHGDNAAAAVYGGLVAVVAGEVLSLELSPLLVPIVAVPPTELLTNEARDALPPSVSHAAAARNSARAVALVEGLRTGDETAFALAGGDELHEQFRAPLAPLAGELMAAARSGGALHAAWSGAGPSVLALATDETRKAVVNAMEAVLAGRGAVITPEVAIDGLRSR